MTVTADLEYRILPVDEWGRLYPLLQQTFPAEDISQLPDPSIGSIAVAEDPETGEILGFMFVQMALHLDPFGCVSGKGVSVRKFHEIIESQLPPGAVYYIFVRDEPRALAAAARNGMIPMPGYVVHRKQVEG